MCAISIIGFFVTFGGRAMSVIEPIDKATSTFVGMYSFGHRAGLMPNWQWKLERCGDSDVWRNNLKFMANAEKRLNPSQ